MTQPNYRLTMNMFLPDGLNRSEGCDAVCRFFVQIADALESLKPGGQLDVSKFCWPDEGQVAEFFWNPADPQTAPVGAQTPDPPSPQPETGLGVSDTCQASQNRQRDAMWTVPDEPLDPVSREDRNQIAERQHAFYEVDR